MAYKKLLAIIDYQNDFVSGSLGFDGAETLDAGICKLAQEYLAMGYPILVTYDTHDDNYKNTREGRHLPVEHCNPNTEGWQLYGKTQELISGTCATNLIFPIRKTTFGIAPEDMVKLKQSIGELDEIQVVGLVSNMCVLSNVCVLQAAWPEAQLIVDADLCASFDHVLHEKTLDILKGIQVEVTHY